MDQSEALAKLCFDAVRAPDWLEFRDQQPHGEADFAIRDSSSRIVGVLEATTAHDCVYLETLNTLTPERQTVAIAKCSRPWRVWPRHDARIRAIRFELDAALSELEAQGVDRFDDASSHPASRTLMGRLGLAMGTRLDEQRETHVIHLPSHGAHVDEESLGGVLLEAAAREDNRRKLGDLTVSERHLFVRVDLTSLAAHYVLGEQLPHKPVHVDDVITHLWVARFVQSSSAVVLHAANGGEWKRRIVNFNTGEIPWGI